MTDRSTGATLLSVGPPSDSLRPTFQKSSASGSELLDETILALVRNFQIHDFKLLKLLASHQASHPSGMFHLCHGTSEPFQNGRIGWFVAIQVCSKILISIQSKPNTRKRVFWDVHVSKYAQSPPVRNWLESHQFLMNQFTRIPPINAHGGWPSNEPPSWL